MSDITDRDFMHHIDNTTDDKRIIDLCMNCPKEDCTGTCYDYENLMCQIRGEKYGKKGWKIIMPRNKKEPKLYEHDGTTLTATAWAARLGISPQAFNWRIRKGWTLEEIVNTQKHGHIKTVRAAATQTTQATQVTT